MNNASSRCLSLSLALCLVLLGGCEKMRQDMHAWARKNSLRKDTAQQTMSGCPPGTEAEERGPDGKALHCKGVDSAVTMAQERYPNGAPMSEMIQNGESLIVVKYYPDGQRKEQTAYLSAEKNGPHITWSKDGIKTLEAMYRNGQLWGPYVERSRNGNPAVSGYYVAGQKSGVWSHYDSEGKLLSRVTWKGDRQTGNAEFFTGTAERVLSEHGAFMNGERTGRWVSYHENGKQKKVGSYLNGEQHGDWIEYGEDGKVLYRNYYKNGRSADKPRLVANVTKRTRDILGAEPPPPSRPKPQPKAKGERGPRPFDEPSGWSDL